MGEPGQRSARGQRWGDHWDTPLAWPSPRVVRLAYNDRVTTETWKQGGSTVRTHDFSYDTVDRLTALDDSDPLATDFEFAYDQRGQLVAERQLSGLIGTSVVFTRQYDDRGNRIELAANFGGTLSGGSVSGGIGDFVNEYVYDERDRLGSVTQTEQVGGHAVAPKHATLIYNRASQLTDLRRYSADWASWSDLEVHSRREYDGAGRLVSITHGNQEISGSQTWDGTSTPPSSLGASGMLAAYRMDYDENHRLASLASYADGFETSFGYDDRDQLTSATSAAISGLSQPYGIPSSESYDFDENGNRKSSGGQSQSDPDTHNQLQSDGTFNYTYDDEGNTLTRTEIASGEVTEYEWDHRNRLVSITEKTSSTGSVTQKIEYIYDAFDQRVGKRLDADGNGTWDRDEAFVWTEGQTHLRLTDSDGEGTTETFHVASRYLHGDIVDHLLADEQFADGAGPAADATTASTTAGETLWALVDHLGSVRDLVANSGVVREHVVYDSFGNRLVEQDYDLSGNAISSSHAEAVDSLFGYTGRGWDKDSGLQYNRARWYDPGTGRWLSQDPIGFDAGDTNLYRYVGNQPTTKTDPSGLVEEPGAPVVVPKPWPNAEADLPTGSVLTGSNMVTHDLDPWGLPTGIGVWPPSFFFNYSSITPHDTRYGCGGLMAMRAGVKPNFPQQVGFVKGAVAFDRLADAQAYLRDELRGAGLIVAAEKLRPLQRFPHAPGPPLIDGYQCPANEVDFIGAFNYRSLLGTPQSWYWEHASGPWRTGGKVLHDQSQFKEHVVFIVLPNAPSRSPIVPSMLHDGSEDSR